MSTQGLYVLLVNFSRGIGQATGTKRTLEFRCVLAEQWLCSKKKKIEIEIFEGTLQQGVLADAYLQSSAVKQAKHPLHQVTRASQ